MLKDPVERFMSFVEPEPNTGCWLWNGSCFKGGYGKFRVGLKSENSRKSVKAHRFSYECFIGTIPKGVKVLHKCDTRPCVNWEHLFLGTIQDNYNDMFLKGRWAKSRKGLPYGVQTLSSGKFQSRIGFENTYYYLGTFDTPEEAGRVSLEKKLQLMNNNGGGYEKST